ncbi:ABC transporter substrate-binding protein [Streptomyces acidicola]|uniref:ABC transporter substrate-binding protein n=1 Tax=Streptomyces acidicola TaxID=2596892 RepID=A0A5N8X6M3_9ACTN|nr:ABC transporter substrate-binding protein [Streptomyces acidicola]MPY55103.1 ABC transporter substrate-binding protein [Streptomyces acidicola]
MRVDRTAGGVTRRSTLLGLAGLGLAAVSGCRLAVDEARGAVSGGARRGGTLIVAINVDAQPDSVQAHNANSVVWRRLVFETLTAYNSSGTPQPLLATDWEIRDGGRTVALNLRDDVRFHTGRPMTARDVMFSLTRSADPAAKSQARAVTSLITDMTADGDHALRIRLSRPASNLFDAFELATILDEESADGIADGSAMIGTGPFRWHTWHPGSGLTMVRNDDYRVPGRPYLDRVEQPAITDPTALVTAVRSGRAHIAYGASPLDARGVSTDGRYEINAGVTIDYSIGMDVRTAPFDDIRVRRAVGYAIDRDRIADQVFAGYGRPTSLWWSKKEAGWSQEQSDTYTYQPDRARELIREAGAAGTEVAIVTNTIQAVQGTAQIVRYNLEEAGLRVRTRVLDPVEYTSRQVEGKLGQLFINGYGIADLSAATFATHPAFAAEQNPSHFTPAEYADLVTRTATAAPDDRVSAVQALGRYMLDQAFNHSIATGQSTIIRSKRVQDVRQTFLGSFIFDDTYVV